MTLILLLFTLFSQIDMDVKTVHVFVALCDNEHQGIVPVSKSLGDGKNPTTNLYWGSAYGMRNYFIKKSGNWNLVELIKKPKEHILERLILKHKNSDTYIVADGYDGEYIKDAIVNFIKASSGGNIEKIVIKDGKKSSELEFGGGSDLVSFIGHDGLMDFDIDESFKNSNKKHKDAIILSCFGKRYFSKYLKQTGVYPLLWSTGLMSAEAYPLEAALEGWIKKESSEKILNRAAESYHKYQKCGLKGAKKLFTTGY
ncbi:hypothetical protein JXR93_00585 [bacterium]|nr:hypothetical protein [bacterium]